MAKLVGRKPVEIKLYDQQNGRVPLFDSASKSWITVDRSVLTSGSAFVSGSQTFIGNQTVSGSLTVTQGITGSLFGTASYADNAWAIGGNTFTGGDSNRILGTLSNHNLLLYVSGSKVATFTTSGSLILTSGSVDVFEDSKLAIYAGATISHNLIKATSDTDGYSQIIIQNTNSGSNASSNIVAIADNGSNVGKFINMGVNSSTFTGSIGSVNDAYLYSEGNNLHIGSISNSSIQLFTGGTNVNTNRKLQLNPNNLHQMTGSLDVSGSIIARSFTGSLFGTASNATTASYWSGSIINAATASYVLQAESASYWSGSIINAATASYVLQAISASYATLALTASNANTASYIENAQSASYWSGSITNAATASYVENAQTASYVQNSQTASYALNAVSASNAQTASYANNFTVAGTLTAQTIVAQTITSSTEFITGSTKNGSLLTNTHQFTGSVSITGSLGINGVDYATISGSASTRLTSLETFSGSYSTGSFTGSFIGCHTGSFSGSLHNLQNTVLGHIPFFTSSQVLADSVIRQLDNGTGSFSIVINQDDITTAAPEALYVYQPSSASYNVISGKGNLNNYLQLNIQNTNTGENASSDVVATANNGNESINFINMGINSEGFTGSVGNENDAYLYSTGNHLHIGNASNFPVEFFAGGIDTEANRKLKLSPNNQHEITGSLKITGGVTASLHGTASWALNASNSQNAVSASFATTASYALISTEPIVVTSPGGIYYINGVVKPALTFVPGQNYRFDTSNVDISHPFKFSLSPNGPTQYTYGVTSGSGYIEINVDYNTSSSLYYYCTIHGGMGNTATTLRAENIISNSQTSSMSVASASFAATASFVQTAQTASFVLNATSASFAATASYALISTEPITVTSPGGIYYINGVANPALTFVPGQNYRFDTSNVDISHPFKFSLSPNGPTQYTYGVTSGSGYIEINVDYNTSSSLYYYCTIHNGMGNTANTLRSEDIIFNSQTSSMSVASASFALTADLLDGKDSTTFATTGSNIFVGNQTITGSFTVSGSTTQIGNNTLSGSITVTGSVNAKADINLGGVLRLDPATDPGSANTTSSFLFTSASNTATGYDLYYRQGSNKVKFKWFEGVLNTGILYGGVLTYSSSYFYVSSGSGIIVNHNAATGSEISPTITYVNWAASSHSIATPTAQNTYVFIDANGVLQQQNAFFTPEQYHEALPIGRVSHYGSTGSLVTGVGNNMLTSYDVPQQLGEFARAFGPLKTSGFTITPQVGNLSLNIGSGTAFNLGGYYQNTPDLPSSYNSNTYLTSSIIRLYRSGSGFQFDNNGGSYYTSVNPTLYDNGTGTLATVGNGNWSIQRVFVNPITGRSHVYYGQSTYTTYLNAVQSVVTDDFVESEVTKNAYVFAGYLVMQGGAGNDDLSVGGTTNAIVQAGLFRNSVGGSGGVSATVSNLNDLSDVNISTPSNGQALIYSSGNWVNGTPVSASHATTASFALTASYISGSGGGVGFPFSGSAVITGSFFVSSSFVDFTQATFVTGSFTGSFSGTASNAVSSSFATSALTSSHTPNAIVTASVNVSTITFVKGDNSTFNLTVAQSGSVESSSFAINAISASHAINANTASFATTASFALFAGNSPGLTTTFTQSIAATTWSFTHNLNTRTPLLQVYDSINSQIIPFAVIGSDPNQATIYFDAPESGFAIATNGGTLTVSGSTARLDQTVAAVTWSFQHNLATKYPNFIVYDSTDNVVIPAGIHAVDDSAAEIYFAFPTTGVAIANFSGISGAPNTMSSSFATTASFASTALNTPNAIVTASVNISTITFTKGDNSTFNITVAQSGSVESSSFAINAISASHAINSNTASFSTDFIIGNTLTIDQTLTDYHTVASSIVGSNNMFNRATGSFSSAFFKYTVANGANARSGEIMAVFAGGAIQFTDNSTLDIGNTSDVTAAVAIAGSSVQFNLTTATSGWRLKSLATFM